MPRIKLPHNYSPREYQLPFLKAFDSGLYDRFVLVWHRRAGKDITCLNLTNRVAMDEPQTITYVFPTLKMGREIMWEGMDNEGNKFLDYYIPKEILDGKPNDTRMTINYKSGSILRIGGSDNPDSLRGGNTKLFVLSEWAEHDPYTWAVIRPIVRANGGKIIFNFTPKGENHAYNTHLEGIKRDKTFCSLLTAKDTGVFTAEQLAEELAELIGEYGEIEGRRIFDQEYMCSFDAPVIGSYYGEQIKRASEEGRITSVPYEPTVPVDTYWDLGIDDSMTIWFVQDVGREIRIIDYYENTGEGIEFYSNVLKEKGYSYGDHYAPHDIEVREIGTGRSRKEVAAGHGIHFQVAPRLSIEDGIQAARSILPRCFFDKNKTERGVLAIKSYHKEWDEKNKVYKNKPKHDWSSHGSDAFRILGVSHKEKGSVPQDAIKALNRARKITQGFYV